MNNLTFIVPTLICLLSQFAPELVQGFSVAAGGNRSVQVFSCEAPGCAANVTLVYCDDELLFSGDHLAQCAGPPPPDSVCQHNGRAFVSTTSGALCEFEGNGYIETKKCTEALTLLNTSTHQDSSVQDTTPRTPVEGVSTVGGEIDVVVLALFLGASIII